MAYRRYLTAVARHLASRLHSTGNQYRCRCGQCRHLILATARRTGIEPGALVKALPPERKSRWDGQAKRRTSTAPVASTMKVTRGGRRLEGTDAVLAVLSDQLE